MALHERNRGLGRFHIGTLDDHFLVVLNFHLHGFVDLHGGTETQGQSYDEAEQDLSAKLHLGRQTFFLVLEGLDVVV